MFGNIMITTPIAILISVVSLFLFILCDAALDYLNRRGAAEDAAKAKRSEYWDRVRADNAHTFKNPKALDQF